MKHKHSLVVSERGNKVEVKSIKIEETNGSNEEENDEFAVDFLQTYTTSKDQSDKQRTESEMDQRQSETKPFLGIPHSDSYTKK